jgi:hypothetical protein
MSAIEAELVKLLKFKKAPEDYEDRQEYLDAIAQTVDKIKDDAVFDAMTEPAYEWLQEAVEAHNKKREIPDFPDAEPEEEAVEEGVEEEPEAGPEVDEETVEETVEEAMEAEADEETVEEEAGKGNEEVRGNEEVEEGPEQSGFEFDEAETPSPEVPVEIPAEQPAKKPRKPKKGSGGRYLKKKKGKPDVQPKNKPGHEPDYKKITGKKNRYGVTAGTKRDLALKMLEKGCTMRDVNIELGDNYYVLLRRLAKEGHLVEKLKNGVIKITHKDDRPKKGK